LLFISCSSENKEDAAEAAEADLSFEKVNEWSISDPSVLPLPIDARVLGDGSVVIVDRSLNTINHFDERGELIRTIGGRGRGPGEYQNISAVAIHPDGRVAVADVSSAAVTVSDIYSEKRVRGTIDPGWNMALQWAGEKLVYSAHPFSMMGENSGDILMKQFDSELESGEQFMRLELQRDDPPEDQVSCMFCRFWFRDDLTFYTTPNDERYLAYHVTPESGETFEISRTNIEPIEYSELEIEELANRRRDAAEMAGIEMDPGDLPRYKRMIITMFIDHNERLWVLRQRADGGQVFDLFNRQHELIGSVPKPGDTLRIISVTGNTVLFQKGIDANEDLVESADTWRAVQYRISG
jgi:hypothetical protein